MDACRESTNADAERMRAFLKQHTTVPNSFVDDIFSMYKPTTSQTERVIDLESVAKWLGMTKTNIALTLKRSYAAGKDYSIEKLAGLRRRPGARATNNYHRVMITPDCFKRICMRTASARGEMVRTYFVEIEGVLARYTQQLIDGIQADVHRLEAAQRAPSQKDYAGYIYVIQASAHRDDLVKIGRTKNLVQRLRAYRTGRAEDVDVLFKYRTDNLKGTEECIKTALREHRYHRYREVYQADVDMIKELAARCAGMMEWKQEYARRKPSQMGGGIYIVVDRGV